MRYEIPATELMDMFRHPDRETEAMLTDLGLVFLESRSAAIDRKVRRRQNRLASVYGADAQYLEGDELLAVYHQERAIVQELTQASQEKPFVHVGQARLERSRRRQQQLSWRGRRPDAENRAARYQTHVEQSVLIDLLQGWQAWLRSVANGERAAFDHPG